MEVFNAPTRENCTVRRERTDTPLQALVTLNDPQFVEAARFLAEQAVSKETATDKRIDYLSSRLLMRPFAPAEKQAAQESLDRLTGYYRSHADDARKLTKVGEKASNAALDLATLAVWTMLTNELMNLDEVLNK
jgi:hypothetical protein